MNQLIEEIYQWQQQTFPDGTSEGRINHFNEEVEEYLQDTSNGEEAADVFMLFVAIFKSEGIDLMKEVKSKLEINKNRKWAKVEGGYSKHIEMEEDNG